MIEADLNFIILMDGYKYSHYNAIDMDIAESTLCKECGGNRKYIGLRHPNGSYRAFAVCQECKKVEEF